MYSGSRSMEHSPLGTPQNSVSFSGSTITRDRFDFAGLAFKTLENPLNISINQMCNKTKEESFGVQGYRSPPKLRKSPKYSVPRNNPKEIEKKKQKTQNISPGPDRYQLGLKWSKKSDNYARFSRAKRVTMMDDICAMQNTKPDGLIIGPEMTYKNEKLNKHRILLGISPRAERSSLTSEMEYFSITRPSPSTYNPKEDYIKPRKPEVKIMDVKNPKKETWKLEKTNGPDMGTYNVKDADKHIKRRIYNPHIMLGIRKSFTDEEEKRAAKIPSMFTYQPFGEKTEKVLYKPMRRYH